MGRSSNNRINKLQANFSLGEVSPKMYGSSDLEQYGAAATTCLNFIPLHLRCLTRRPGTYFIKALEDQTKQSRLIPFIFSNDQAYILEFSEGILRIYKDQGIVLDGPDPAEIFIQYQEDDLPDLKFAQSFNVLYITHPNYAPKQLVRVSDINWTLTDIPFVEPPYLDANIDSTKTVTPSGTTGTITITSVGNLFASTDVGRYIRIESGPQAITGVNWLVYPGTGSQQYFDVTFFPHTSSTMDVKIINADGTKTTLTYTSGAPSPGQYTIVGDQVKLAAAASSSEQVEIIEKNAGTGIWGYALIGGYTNANQVAATVISPLENTNTTYRWRFGAFSDTTGYPECVELYEQRLWFANTRTSPNRIWGSQIQNFPNFSPDDINKQGDVTADTSVSFVLTTPGIQWLKGTQALVAGCQDGIIQINSQSGALSAVNPPVTRKDQNIQTSTVSPALAQNHIIYAEHLNKRMHALSYGLSTYGFQQSDISNFSDHLLDDGSIKQIVYSSTPNSLIWCLTTEGKLLSCLFRVDKGLVGWTRHQLGGTDVEVESVAVIPGASYTELWLIVKRIVDGDTVRYVEVLQQDFEFQDLEDAFFVDSGLSFDGAPTNVFSNLDHLEGETVAVLADGTVHPNCVVTSGDITLDGNYSVVHAGLPYNSDFESLQIEGGSVYGTSQMSISRVIEAGIKLYNSINFLVGSSLTSLQREVFRTTNDDLGEAVPLFTGNHVFKYSTGFAIGYKLAIRQDQPLPITILSIVYKAEINDL